MTALCDVLNKHLPANCSYRHPEGGYFVWIKLPEGKWHFENVSTNICVKHVVELKR